jgi:outer membrane protein
LNTCVKTLGKIGCIAVLITFSLTAFAQAADRIGYIDVQRIISESAVGKKKIEEYNRLRDRKDAELRQKLAAMEALNSGLNRERAREPVNQEKIRALLEKLQDKNREIERFAADARAELAQKDAEAVAEILQIVAPILMQIGEAGGYAIIWRNIHDIAYMGPGVDITDEVIKALDQKQ